MKKAIKIILLITSVLVLLLGSLAVLGYYTFLHTTPLNTQELAELEVDWTPVTKGNWSPWVIADDGSTQWNPGKSINDWLASVPEEDKAWAELVDIRYGHPSYYANEDLSNQPMYPSRWAKSIELLDTEEAAEIFDSLLDVFNRPVMGAGCYNEENPIEIAAAQKYGEQWAVDLVMDAPDAEIEMFRVLLPSLGLQRNISMFTLAQSFRQLELQEPDVFIEGCSAVMNSAELANEVPTLIGELVKIAIREQTIQTIDQAIDRRVDSFTDEQLSALDQLLADPDLFAVRWQGEAMMFEDTIRRIADTDGSMNPWVLRGKAQQVGSYTLGPATDLPVTKLSASAQRLIYIHREVLQRDLGDVNDPDFGSGMSFYQDQRSKLGRFEQITLDILLPALGKAKDVSMRGQRYANAVRLAIAVQRHQLRHGTLPDSIGTLDADLLAGMDAMDPYSEEMLSYQRTDDGCRILPSHPEDEPGVILWPKQYEPIVEDDEPEYYDWELEGMTEEQKEEVLNSP